MENELHSHDYIVCPNCNEKIEGRYCNFCGQKYHQHKETFTELVYEFFSDFTHWDSRFFRTVIPLIIKPGKLTKDYCDGKRNQQFHPIRLYIFSSFVYFFLVFSCNENHQSVKNNEPDNVVTLGNLNTDIKTTKDTASNAETIINRNKNNEPILFARADSSLQFSAEGINGLDSLLRANTTPEQYDAWQNKLPESKRHNFIKRYSIKRALHLYEEGKRDGNSLMEKLESSVLHNIPKMMFFLLPVFALILKLLYFRQKQYYYVDHAVLSLHYFSFIFLMLILFQIILGPLIDFDLFFTAALLWIVIYLFIAMKRFYGQGFFKTLIKYFLLGFMFFIAFTFAMMINLIFSAALQI